MTVPINEQMLESKWLAEGMVGTTTPYQPVGVDITSNGRYSGTVPTGPYTHAWEGVQKINAVAHVGTHYALDFIRLPGAVAHRTTFINLNNPTGRYIGPGIVTAQSEAAASMVHSNAPKSRSWLSKLFGG